MKILDWFVTTTLMGFIAIVMGSIPLAMAWDSFNPFRNAIETEWDILWMCLRVTFWMWVYGVILYVYMPMVKRGA